MLVARVRARMVTDHQSLGCFLRSVQFLDTYFTKKDVQAQVAQVSNFTADIRQILYSRLGFPILGPVPLKVIIRLGDSTKGHHKGCRNCPTDACLFRWTMMATEKRE